jgi:hypothetical protein
MSDYRKNFKKEFSGLNRRTILTANLTSNQVTKITPYLTLNNTFASITTISTTKTPTNITTITSTTIPINTTSYSTTNSSSTTNSTSTTTLNSPTIPTNTTTATKAPTSTTTTTTYINTTTNSTSITNPTNTTTTTINTTTDTTRRAIYPTLFALKKSAAYFTADQKNILTSSKIKPSSQMPSSTSSTSLENLISDENYATKYTKSKADSKTLAVKSIGKIVEKNVLFFTKANGIQKAYLKNLEKETSKTVKTDNEIACCCLPCCHHF